VALEKLTVVNGVEQVLALPWLADVCVDEQRVCLRVDVLHHDLETVEASCLGYLHLAGESLYKVLVDDTIRGGEEGEDVGDEEALVIVETLVPVVEILGQINLFGSPERSFSLLVHLPDLEGYYVSQGPSGVLRRVYGRVKHVEARKLTSWYLMGKRTKRFGFSWRRGSCASSALIVGATPVFATGSSSGRSGMPTMGLKIFSLSADEKSSFFAGELDILSELIADAAYNALVCTRKWSSA
jgi:hypothetical protein